MCRTHECRGGQDARERRAANIFYVFIGFGNP